jgi:hypothetical protein
MATPQDNYITPGRAGFIGQVGNIGSANGLAGGAANASIGGTATNGVQSSNAATSAAFAVVKTVGGPTGMKAGGGASAPAVSSSSFQPAAIQADVNAAKLEQEPVQFTPALASTAATSTNENFPKSNKVAELPSPVGFNKASSVTTLGTAGTIGKADYRGITNTVANAGENDLTIATDNFNVAKDSPNDYVNGAAQDGQLPPLYRPANEPGGQGPNYANAPSLAGNRSNSSLLPNSNG